LILTASGTILDTPVALMVIYRFSAADAGTARQAPPKVESPITKAIIARIGFSLIRSLSRISKNCGQWIL